MCVERKTTLLMPRILFFVSLCFASFEVLAFDIGSHIFNEPDKKFYMEVMLEEYTREMAISLAHHNNEALQNTDSEVITESNVINILAIRPTLVLSDKFSMYTDFGLYNDLETPAGTPLFVGGGARFILAEIGKVQLIPFGALHVTQSYLSEFDNPTPDPDTRCNVKLAYKIRMSGRVYHGAVGALLASEIAVNEDLKVHPYMGMEYSVQRSNVNYQASFRCVDGSGVFTLEGDKAQQVRSVENWLAVFGVSLLRKKSSTIRMESRVRKGNFGISVNFGFFF